MNKLIFLIVCILSSWILDNPTASIQGKVTTENDEPVLFATVSLYLDGVLVKGTETDFDGNYHFPNLEAGTYEVEATYVGLETKREYNVKVKKDKVVVMDITMKDSGELMEAIEIVEYKVPVVEFDNTTSGRVYSASDIRNLPTKDISEIATTSAALSKSKSKRNTLDVRGSRSEASYYYIDGIPVSSEKAAKMIPPAEIIGEVKSSSRRHEETELPSAGQLTAGEWNDLNNWTDWKALINDGVYQKMLDIWQTPRGERYALFLTNEMQLPVVNAEVHLVDRLGTIYWIAKTDNKGKAELWNVGDSNSDRQLVIFNQGKTFVIDDAVGADDGSNHLEIDVPCQTKSAIDIMLVVDATGSMLDEIAYLRSELNDVIYKVKEAHSSNLELRLGSVFYQDEGDSFLTKESALNEDIEECVEFIRRTNGGGGGDTPEAVEAGLEVALSQEWNANALSRIIFLILDAPPHQDDEVLKKLNRQIEEAAKLGIKVIPIAASGIDRETEYLLKQMAMLTNGTYLFLTDDSGIGSAHLEHVLPDYEVEKLNDLLVRLISNYTKQASCEKESIPVETIIKLYPIPASSVLNIEMSETVDGLRISSSTGKQLLKLNQLDGKKQQIQVGDFISGMYNVSIIEKGSIIETRPFMVIN